MYKPHELYEALVSAMPADQIDHQYSDLLVKATNTSLKIIHDFGVNHCMYEMFRDQITGTEWIDLYFQYTPYWEEKAKENRK